MFRYESFIPFHSIPSTPLDYPDSLFSRERSWSFPLQALTIIVKCLTLGHCRSAHMQSSGKLGDRCQNTFFPSQHSYRNRSRFYLREGF